MITAICYTVQAQILQIMAVTVLQSPSVRLTLIKAAQYQYNTKITLTGNSFSHFFLLKISSQSWRGRLPYDFALILITRNQINQKSLHVHATQTNPLTELSNHLATGYGYKGIVRLSVVELLQSKQANQKFPLPPDSCLSFLFV